MRELVVSETVSVAATAESMLLSLQADWCAFLFAVKPCVSASHDSRHCNISSYPQGQFAPYKMRQLQTVQSLAWASAIYKYKTSVLSSALVPLCVQQQDHSFCIRRQFLLECDPYQNCI